MGWNGGCRGLEPGVVGEVLQEVGVTGNGEGRVRNGKNLPSFLLFGKTHVNPPFPLGMQLVFDARGRVWKVNDHAPENLEHAEVRGVAMSLEIGGGEWRKGAGGQTVANEGDPWQGKRPPRRGQGHVMVDSADHLRDGTIHAFGDAILLRVVRDGALEVNATVTEVGLEAASCEFPAVITVESFEGGVKVALCIWEPSLDGGGDITLMGKSERPEVAAPIIHQHQYVPMIVVRERILTHISVHKSQDAGGLGDDRAVRRVADMTPLTARAWWRCIGCGDSHAMGKVTVEEVMERASGWVAEASMPASCGARVGRIVSARCLALHSGRTGGQEGVDFKNHLAAPLGTVQEVAFGNGAAIRGAQPPRGKFPRLSGSGAAHECATFTKLSPREEVAFEAWDKENVVNLERAARGEVTLEADAPLGMGELLSSIGHTHDDRLGQIGEAVEEVCPSGHVLISTGIPNPHVGGVICCGHVDHVSANASRVDGGWASGRVVWRRPRIQGERSEVEVRSGGGRAREGGRAGWGGLEHRQWRLDADVRAGEGRSSPAVTCLVCLEDES